MDIERWRAANTLVHSIRDSEELAGAVARWYFHLRTFGPEGVSHPSEDEAKSIQKRLAELRKVAAGIAEREALS